MKTQVVVAAGGLGLRLNKSLAKPLILLKDKPLLIYCLEVFSSLKSIHSIIVAASKENVEEFKRIIEQHKIAKIAKIIEGGKIRRESVEKGLLELDSDTDCVVIHDGVRPFVDSNLVEEVITLAKKEKAAVLGVPVKPTIKKIDKSQMSIKETLNRDELWEIQTPQVFLKEVIVKAHEENKDIEATDDAYLVEKLGIKVRVVEGSYNNIKITTQDDLIIAQAILASRKG